jgi:hypothetical protein
MQIRHSPPLRALPEVFEPRKHTRYVAALGGSWNVGDAGGVLQPDEGQDCA